MQQKKKLKICVSACLLGFKYRYNGKSATLASLLELLKDKADFIPVCPEVESGFPIPRPPMELRVSPRGTRLVVIETGEDVTAQVLSWTAGKLEQLGIRKPDGFLFKAKSPCCGLGSTKVFTKEGKSVTESGYGLFAALFRKRFAAVPAGEDTDLEEFLKKLNIT